MFSRTSAASKQVSANATVDAYKVQLSEITKAWSELSADNHKLQQQLDKSADVIRALRSRLVQAGVPVIEIQTIVSSGGKLTLPPSGSTSRRPSAVGVERSTDDESATGLPLQQIDGGGSAPPSGPLAREPCPSRDAAVSSPSTAASSASSSASAAALLLSHSLPMSYGRDSPFSYAGLAHSDARIEAMEAYLKHTVGLARDYEAAGGAWVAAADKLGSALIATVNQPWCARVGSEPVVTSLSLLGHALRDSAALWQAAGTSIHHAFGTSVEVDLLPLAARTRQAKRVWEGSAVDAQAAMGRLMALRRGATPGEVLGRASEAVQTSHRAELARFDAVAAVNSLEAKRRILLVEKACAAAGALQAYYTQAGHAMAKLDAHMRSWGESAHVARRRAAARDGAWRMVRDALETDLVRLAQGGLPSHMLAAGDGDGDDDGMSFGQHQQSADEGQASTGTGSNAAGAAPSKPPLHPSSGSTSIGMLLLRQATSPLDRVSDAVLKAAVSIGTRMESIAAAAATQAAKDDAADEEQAVAAAAGGESVDSLSSDAAVPAATSAAPPRSPPPQPTQQQPGNSSTGHPHRASGTMSGVADVPIAGWLYKRSTVSGKGSGGGSGSGSGVQLGSSPWSRRWFFVKGGRLLTMSETSLAPVLVADLATCNVREGTDDDDGPGVGGGGAIGVVGIGSSASASAAMTASSTGLDSNSPSSSTAAQSSSAHASGFTAGGSSASRPIIIDRPDRESTTSSSSSSSGGLGKLASAVSKGVGKAARLAQGAAKELLGSDSGGSSGTGSGQPGSPHQLPPDALPVSYATAHAFEVRTPSRVLVLAAPTLAQRRDWVRVLREQAEAALVGGTPSGHANGGSGSARGGASSSSSSAISAADVDVPALVDRLRACSHTGGDIDAALAVIHARNPTCVDCGAPGPDWASLSLGCVFCLACSGVHRSLGVHISKVRSLVLDSWEPAHLLVMLGLGNQKVNEIYGASIPEGEHLRPNGDRDTRERVIRAKYEARAFVVGRLTQQQRLDDHGAADAPEVTAAASSGDLVTLLRFLARCPDHHEDGHVGVDHAAMVASLHAACRHGQLGAVALLMGHANADAGTSCDVSTGYTPLESYVVDRVHRGEEVAADDSGVSGDHHGIDAVDGNHSEDETGVNRTISELSVTSPGGAESESSRYPPAVASTSKSQQLQLEALAHLLLPKRLRGHAVAVCQGALSAAERGDRDAAMAVLTCEQAARQQPGPEGTHSESGPGVSITEPLAP